MKKTHNPDRYNCPLPPQKHLPQNAVIDPGQNDVLLGRGVLRQRKKKANILFRDLVDSFAISYTICSKSQRMNLVQSLVSHIRYIGGNFLEKDRYNSLWFEIGDKRALQRTDRALRDRCSWARTAIFKGEKAKDPPPSVIENQDLRYYLSLASRTTRQTTLSIVRGISPAIAATERAPGTTHPSVSSISSDTSFGGINNRSSPSSRQPLTSFTTEPSPYSTLTPKAFVIHYSKKDNLIEAIRWFNKEICHETSHSEAEYVDVCGI